ncbi:MAG: hypothetical protein AAF405_08590, partial [Pseudomonadota bacterium]
TASTVQEEWALGLANGASDESSPCSQTPPHCLRIQLSPTGKTFRIRNRCDETYRGIVRIMCSAWEPDAATEFRFSLGAKSEIAQEGLGTTAGRTNGTCYIRTRLCSKAAAPTGQQAASSAPPL